MRTLSSQMQTAISANTWKIDAAVHRLEDFLGRSTQDTRDAKDAAEAIRDQIFKQIHRKPKGIK